MTREKRWTPGPWFSDGREIDHPKSGPSIALVCSRGRHHSVVKANSHLIAAAPRMIDEMERYLPLLERAEADPVIWDKLTEGTGIATANGYRYAIAKAYGDTPTEGAYGETEED